MRNRGYKIFIRTFSSAALLAIALLLVPYGFAGAVVHDLGRSGNVYEVREGDALEEIKARVKAVTVEEKESLQRQMKERVASYKPFNAVDLPPAASDDVRMVDMTHTLEFDISDGKGGILYPKGYTFNPLEYVPFSQTIVVFNGSLKREVDWFLSSEYVGRADVKVLLTGGEWGSLTKRLKRRVFYLTSQIAERFQLKATPSVVAVRGNRYMEVKEVYVRNEE